MIILVTGCAGFIGYHLCKRLLSERHVVVGIDNYITGSEANVTLLRKYKHFTFIEQDVTKGAELEWINYLKIDQVYHLASIASPEHYLQFPLETIKVNTIGTENMLELAWYHGAKFLYTSTSECYGDPEVSPQAESYKGSVNTYGPRACYDESKRLGETIVYEYKRKYNMDTKIVRIFNTYGPNMNLDDKRVVIEFIKNALGSQALVVFGDGLQTRSFTYVDDTVDGLIKMMNSKEEGPINIGNDKTEKTVLDLAHIIISKTKSSSTIEYKNKMQDDPCVRRPDITLAKTKLNWEPTTDLDTGLTSTIEWVTSQL